MNANYQVIGVFVFIEINKTGQKFILAALNNTRITTVVYVSSFSKSHTKSIPL